MQAAGHPDLCTGDIAGIIGAEVVNRSGDVIGCAHSIEGNAGDQRLVVGLDDFYLYLAGRHRVDTHAEDREFVGHLTGEAGQGSF